MPLKTYGVEISRGGHVWFCRGLGKAGNDVTELSRTDANGPIPSMFPMILLPPPESRSSLRALSLWTFIPLSSPEICGAAPVASPSVCVKRPSLVSMNAFALCRRWMRSEAAKASLPFLRSSSPASPRLFSAPSGYVYVWIKSSLPVSHLCVCKCELSRSLLASPCA